MRGERTAADARRWHDHIAAVASQSERGASIRTAKHFVLDASGKETNPGATRALTRRQRRQRRPVRPRIADRREGGELAERQHFPRATPP